MTEPHYCTNPSLQQTNTIIYYHSVPQTLFSWWNISPGTQPSQSGLSLYFIERILSGFTLVHITCMSVKWMSLLKKSNYYE